MSFKKQTELLIVWTCHQANENKYSINNAKIIHICYTHKKQPYTKTLQNYTVHVHTCWLLNTQFVKNKTFGNMKTWYNKYISHMINIM